eukprot:1934108-Amphidinium_carterae.2
MPIACSPLSPDHPTGDGSRGKWAPRGGSRGAIGTPLLHLDLARCCLCIVEQRNPVSALRFPESRAGKGTSRHPDSCRVLASSCQALVPPFHLLLPKGSGLVVELAPLAVETRNPCSRLQAAQVELSPGVHAAPRLQVGSQAEVSPRVA